MRGQKNPFASPHAISHANRKAPSGQELSEQIVSLFKNPDAAVKEIQMSNDRQVVATVTSLISQYKTASDWDSKLDVITQLMGIVKGGACNFISFVQQLEKLEPLISECILSLRSALVKFSCLLVAQLSEKLRESFAGPVLALIPTLFRPTQNGTLLIADSCKLAILSVASCCQSKRVLTSILEMHTSKSGVQRTVAAHCVFLIVTNWQRDIVVGSFRAIEKALLAWLSDPNPDARQFARDSVRKLQEIVPEKCKRMMAKTDERTRVSLNGEQTVATVKPSKRSASVGGDKRANPVRQSAITPKAAKMAMAQPEKPTFEKGKERGYLSYLRQLILQGESNEIIQKASEISESIIASMCGSSQEIVVLAMTILDGVITIIPDAFLVHLSVILMVLFEQSMTDAAGAKRMAEKLTELVGDLYPPDELMDALVNCPASWPAFLFVDKLLRTKTVNIDRTTLEAVVKLCAGVEYGLQEDGKELVTHFLTFLREKFESDFLAVVDGLDEKTQTNLKYLIVNKDEEPEEKEVPEVVINEEEKPVVETEVVQRKQVGKLMTLSVFDVPPEPQLMWQLENSPSTIVTIEPSRQPLSPGAAKRPFQRQENEKIEPVRRVKFTAETIEIAEGKPIEFGKQESVKKGEEIASENKVNCEAIHVEQEKKEPVIVKKEEETTQVTETPKKVTETKDALPKQALKENEDEKRKVETEEKVSSPMPSVEPTTVVKKMETEETTKPPRVPRKIVKNTETVVLPKPSPEPKKDVKKAEETVVATKPPPEPKKVVKNTETVVLPKPSPEPKKIVKKTNDGDPRRVVKTAETEENTVLSKKVMKNESEPRRTIKKPEDEEEFIFAEKLSIGTRSDPRKQVPQEPEPRRVNYKPEPKRTGKKPGPTPKPSRLQTTQNTSLDTQDQEFLSKLRAQVSPQEHQTMPQLVRMLLTVQDKLPILDQIAELLESDHGKDLDIVLPHLIRLTRSPISPDVERVLQIAGNYIDSDDLLDTVIGLLDEPDPCPFIEFLSRVVACATKLELAPRIRRIMNKLVPYLSHSQADVRKHAVLCIVEIRFVMGSSFDMEIARLKNVPRKLVIHYFQKRQAQS